MKIQMQQQVEVLFGGQLDSIDSAMRDIYLDGYYRTAYEVHKGVGFGWDFGTLDQRRIDKIINKPWAQDGRNFSDRVWSNKQKLVDAWILYMRMNYGQTGSYSVKEKVISRLILCAEKECETMLRPTAVLIEPVENYQLMVEFDNGEKKKFDVKPYIQGSFYGQLSDPAYFKSVKTNGYSVEWENGQDLCPDELYYNSIPATGS